MSFKKGFTYVFFSNLLAFLISVITGFILPKLLSIDTYSTIKLFQLYITYVGILHLGFSDGMYLKYGGKDIKKMDNGEIKTEFKTFKCFQLFVTILFLIISLILKNIILVYCCLSILPINVGNYLRNLYQATGRFDSYAKFTNLNTLFGFFVNLFLLFIIKTDNAHFYILGYILFYFIYWFFLELEMYRLFDKKRAFFNFNYIIKNVKSGFFLMIGNFCNVIFTGIDRIFVQKLLGGIEFAYYSFAVSIENLLNTFITPLTAVMYNYFCHNSNTEDVKRVKNIVLLLGGLLISSVFIIKILVFHFLDKYTSSLNVLYILFVAQYFSFVIKCVHLNLFKAKKLQNVYFGIMVVIIILSVILNLVFFNINNSIVFIAYATLIVNFIWFLVGELYFKNYWLNYKEYFYVLIILISFIILNAFIINNYVAFIIYIVIYLIFTFILNKETLTYLAKELNKMVKKKQSGRLLMRLEKPLDK